MSLQTDLRLTANAAFRGVRAVNAKDMELFCGPLAGAEMSPESVVRDHANAHWMMLDGDGRLAARCSLWWKHVPEHDDERVGLIGHFAANEVAGAAMLQHACRELAAHGCTLAIGPMDGSSWRRYRLVTERGTEPPFFMEPDNPDYWVDQFRAAGFQTLASYFSALNTDLTRRDPRLQRMIDNARNLEITIRPLRIAQFEHELHRLYGLTGAFAFNFLFTPISESDFVAQFMPLAAYVQPELVLIAEVSHSPVGFVFCLPDLLQARRGCPIDTVIVKTLAVIPQFEGIGLGGLLVARANEKAAELGYRRVIYALMHEHNFSRNISRRYGQTMRRYELFAKTIAPLT